VRIPPWRTNAAPILARALSMPWRAVRQPLELARLRRTRAGVAEGDHHSVIRPRVDVDATAVADRILLIGCEVDLGDLAVVDARRQYTPRPPAAVRPPDLGGSARGGASCRHRRAHRGPRQERTPRRAHRRGPRRARPAGDHVIRPRLRRRSLSSRPRSGSARDCRGRTVGRPSPVGCRPGVLVAGADADRRLLDERRRPAPPRAALVDDRRDVALGGDGADPLAGVRGGLAGLGAGGEGRR